MIRIVLEVERSRELATRGETLNPLTLRLIGFLFIVGAVVAAVLNLHRVADLRMPWLAPLLLVLGAALVFASRRSKR
jgi:hypothetical protein